jgi:hypothetical protein
MGVNRCKWELTGVNGGNGSKGDLMRVNWSKGSSGSK